MRQKKKILFASNNRGKYEELKYDFSLEGIDLIFYKDIQDTKLVLPEDSEILSENAKLKSTYAAATTGYMTLGDDSGIFITAADFFPGVHSRRWSGEETDDTGRNEKILELLKDEKDDRSVYLISRFSLSDENGNEIYKTVVKNEFTIADAINGDSGFGYDPILVPGVSYVESAVERGLIEVERGNEIMEQHMTIGQLSQEEKNAINNRGRIAKGIREFLDSKE